MKNQMPSCITECITIPGNYSKDSGKPCVFPFTLDNMTYHGCTNYKHEDGKYWCSTLTDSQHFHMRDNGHFGYCPDDCKKSDGVPEGELFLKNLRYMKSLTILHHFS